MTLKEDLDVMEEQDLVIKRALPVGSEYVIEYGHAATRISYEPQPSSGWS